LKRSLRSPGLWKRWIIGKQEKNNNRSHRNILKTIFIKTIQGSMAGKSGRGAEKLCDHIRESLKR
jgi:hypothetical protein